MASQNPLALGRQEGHTGGSRSPHAVHLATTLLAGSRAEPLPLGRFLLSSTGVHLLLAWVVISIGLPRAPSTPRPLVVTIIGSMNSESLTSAEQLDRTRAKQSVSSAGPKHVVPPRPASPPPPQSIREKTPEGNTKPLPAAERMEPIAVDDRVAEPKAVGISVGRLPAVDVGKRGVVAAGSLPSGPMLLSPDEDGAVGSDSVNRSGIGRLDASLAAPLTPSVTIGSPQSGTGGRADRASNGAASGGFAAPNYGINPLPKYPPLAREKGYEGTVYLRVMVKVDGRVGQLAVDRSSGYEILDRTAVDSVQEWAFFPAKKGGRPVASWVLLPVKFALN